MLYILFQGVSHWAAIMPREDQKVETSLRETIAKLTGLRTWELECIFGNNQVQNTGIHILIDGLPEKFTDFDGLASMVVELTQKEFPEAREIKCLVAPFADKPGRAVRYGAGMMEVIFVSSSYNLAVLVSPPKPAFEDPRLRYFLYDKERGDQAVPNELQEIELVRAWLILHPMRTQGVSPDYRPQQLFSSAADFLAWREHMAVHHHFYKLGFCMECSIEPDLQLSEADEEEDKKNSALLLDKDYTETPKVFLAVLREIIDDGLKVKVNEKESFSLAPYATLMKEVLLTLGRNHPEPEHRELHELIEAFPAS